MKTSQGALLQFSGYPLRIAENSSAQKEVKKPKLTIVKKDSGVLPEKESITNNPQNWDLSWFCNYE
ncbi:MAG TPA: hypothetical protein VFQ73_12830 [Flavisolibacter sp.]|nr:hypothetical protein [Flavisolibacter sp.]